MSVQIRIAKNKKKSNAHREFNDFEKSLNKLSTSEEFIEYFIEKPDPYALKAIPDEAFKEVGQPINIFRHMSSYKLKEFCKFYERTEQWRSFAVEPVVNAARWIFNIFKDITHKETSECLAMVVEAQKRLWNHPELIDALDDNAPKDKEKLQAVVDIIQSVIQEFQNHWTEYMEALQRLTF